MPSWLWLNPAKLCPYWTLSTASTCFPLSVKVTRKLTCGQPRPNGSGVVSDSHAEVIHFVNTFEAGKKMDHPSTRHAPSTLSPPTRLHNRLYLVSQSWWGNPLSGGHWRRVEISLWLGPWVQYATVRPKRKVCLGQNTFKWLKRKLRIGILLTAAVNVTDLWGNTYITTTSPGLPPPSVRTSSLLTFWHWSKLCNHTLCHHKGLDQLEGWESSWYQ